MGKTKSGSPSDHRKGKGKGKAKSAGAGKKGKKSISQTDEAELLTPSSADQEPPSALPVIHELDESDQGEELAPRRKRSRPETTSVPAQGSSSHFEAWIPNLMYRTDPISVRDIILDNSKIEILVKVAHGLSRASCLPEDMKVWDPMHSGQIFHHISRGLMLVSVFPCSLFYFFFIILYFLCPFLFFFLGCSGRPLHGD